MDTVELRNIGQKYFKDNFIDCVSWYELHRIKQKCKENFGNTMCKVKFLIVNLDEIEKPGMHWIVLCNIPGVESNEHFFYFDSFGIEGLNSIDETNNKPELDLTLQHTTLPDLSELKYLTNHIEDSNKVFDKHAFEPPVEYYTFNPRAYNAKIVNKKLASLFDTLKIINLKGCRLSISSPSLQHPFSKTCGEFSLLFIDLVNRIFNLKEVQTRKTFEDIIFHFENYIQDIPLNELPYFIAKKTKEIFGDNYAVKKKLHFK